MKPLALPAIAALLGIAVLMLLAPRVHPARLWGYRLDREQAVALAEAQALAFGISTQGWHAYVGPETRNELEYYKQRYADDPAAALQSAYLVDVAFVNPDGRQSVAVRLFADGRIASWERKDAGSRPWTMKTMQSAVDSAFHAIAGRDASQYHLITESAATREGLRFTWERTRTSPDFQPTIDVIVRDGAVVHAETHYAFSKSFENEFDRRDESMNWFTLVYVVQTFLLGLSAVTLYTLGSIRKRVNQRFAIAFCVVNVLSLAAAFWLGAGLENARASAVFNGAETYSANLGAFGYSLALGTLVGLTAAGGGLVAAGKLGSRWWSLRLLLSRRWYDRQVGFSVAVGILSAPLLAVSPLIAAAIFPSSIWGLRQITQLFNPHPVLQTGGDLLRPLVVIFFGVVFGLLWNRPWPAMTRFPIAISLATIFFTGLNDLLQAPLIAFLFAGGLLAIVQIWLFLRFDLLSVVVAAGGFAMLNLAIPALLQPSQGLQSIGWQFITLLAALLTAGLVLVFKAPAALREEEIAIEPLSVQSEREGLRSEFLVAQRAQREMLPADPPGIPGFTLAASCTPAREVGGDLYDFVPLSQGRLAIAVADVSGKGVPAALYMTLTKGLLAATTQDELPLPAILEQINAHFCTVGKRKTFVTMALGILDPGTRSLEYARAGHNPVVWRRRQAGTTALLSPKGLGLGITPGRVFGRTLVMEKLDLNSGDTLVFYSDGLTEAMNVDLEQFGEERLMRVVERVEDLPAAPARDAILREVAEFLNGVPAQDDLTLVVLHVD